MGLETKKSTGEVNQAVFKRGDRWHTDGPWDQEICKATQLYGLEIPSQGGDTLFTNMQTTYEALPAALQARIAHRSEEPTSELPSLMRTSYAVFRLKKRRYSITDITGTIQNTTSHTCKSHNPMKE